MKIKALIVDDEPLARERLKEMLGRESDIYHIAEAADGDEAIAVVKELKPDLMFLDVQMPKRDGFGVLKGLEGGRMPVVIFTTAFDQHALAAFESHAVDYVLKPFKATRLHEAVQRARELLAGRGAQEAVNRLLKMMAEREEAADAPRLTRLAIKNDNKTIFVKIEEVDWIEAAGNYMVVHAGDANHILRETMMSLEQQLPAAKFLRVNRSTIVNLDRVRELQPLTVGEYAVKLKNGAVITMTRGVREVEQWLKFH